MEVQIVPVKNEKAEEVINLILHIQQKEFNVPITLEDQPDLLDIQHFYYENGGGFWAAFVDGSLVGTIALIKFESGSGAIRKMFVKREFRGKEWNIAKQLLETLVTYSREIGLGYLYLGTVSILEAALRFYEKNHFTRVEKEMLPKAFPLMNPDNVFCKLVLN